MHNDSGFYQRAASCATCKKVWAAIAINLHFFVNAADASVPLVGPEGLFRRLIGPLTCKGIQRMERDLGFSLVVVTKKLRGLAACLLTLSACAPLKPGPDPTALAMMNALEDSAHCSTAEAPRPPSHLDTVTVEAHSVTLSWWASPSPETGSYLLFRNGQPIASVAPKPSGAPLGAPLQFTDHDVTPTSLYVYSVAAKGPCGKVSAHSQDLVVNTKSPN